MATTIAEAYVQILPSADGISGELNKILGGEASSAGTTASSKFGSTFTKGLATVGKVGAAALATTTTAVVGFGTSAVKAGADFDSAMSQVAATMGYSTDELNDNTSEAAQTMETLRNFAQEMGSTTAFSATEASEALNYMALAGYDAETSMEMLPTVLDLASAGGIDLASASDMVTDAQSALGLELSETKDMVDQMAAASSKSNTSVSQLGEAFLTIGATARNVAGGTEELSTVLGVLADNGIKGSEGGTHLRNMLLSLQDAAVDGKVKMGDFSVEVYDAEGNMRSMVDIIGDMQTGMEGMTQESKDALVSGVFNKTDLASVNALLGTSQERFTELSTAISDSAGAAENMAGVQLDNLEGDVTLFKSALEGAKIAVSDELTPTLREFVSFGTDGITQLTEAFQSGGLEGAASTLGTLIADGLSLITSKLPDIVAAGATLLESLISGITSNISNITTTAVDIINTLSTSIMSILPQLFDAGLQILTGIINGIAQSLPTLIPAAIDMIEALGDALIDNLPLLLDAAVALLEAIVTGIVDNIGDLVEASTEIAAELTNLLISKAPELLQAGVEMIVQLVQGLINALPQLIPAGIKLMNMMSTAIINNLPVILEAGITIIGELIAGLIQATPDIIDQIPEITNQMKDSFTSIDWASLGKSIIEGIKNGISSAASSIATAAKDAAKTAYEAAKEYLGINSPSKLFRDGVGSAIPEGMALGIETNTDYVSDAMNDLSDVAAGSIDYNRVIAGATSYKYGDSDGYVSELEGMTFTVYETLELGGTKLKDIISQYTIQQIGNETRAVKVAQGGYYGI